MDELEMAARQLGADFGEKWKEMPGRNGTGFMVWDDCEHCIYVDFFGSYQGTDKARITTTLIMTNDEHGFPYSLRIGFHETEEDARKTMKRLLIDEE
jgi:hypothetical protein